jgi:hypothetical protein
MKKRTTHNMPSAEISRRLMRVYEIALRASEREYYEMVLTAAEIREARRLLMELCGAELRLVATAEDT